MQQPHWEPGDVIGRIKLVVAEGVVREDCNMVDSNMRLDRLRDVVSFSFQHAPLGMSNHTANSRLTWLVRCPPVLWHRLAQYAHVWENHQATTSASTYQLAVAHLPPSQPPTSLSLTFQTIYGQSRLTAPDQFL